MSSISKGKIKPSDEYSFSNHSTTTTNGSDFHARCKNAARALNLCSSASGQSKNGLSERCHLIFNIFWAIIFVVFAYATIRSAASLVRGYVNQQKSLQTTIVMNTPFTLPQTSICLPIHPSELEDQGGLNQNEMDQTKSSSNFSTALSKFFENNTNNGNGFLGSSNWPPEILFVTHNYLASITQIETFGQGNAENENKTEEEINDMKMAKMIVEKQLNLLKMTIDDLKTRFGSQIFRLYQAYIHVTQYGLTTAFQIDLPFKNEQEAPPFVDYTKICYHKRFDLLNPFRRGSNDYIQIQATQPLLPDLREGLAEMLIQFTKEDPTRETSNMAITSYQAISVPFQHDWSVKISIDAIYRQMSIQNGQVVCSETTSLIACRMNCRGELIRKLCNCTATTFENTENVPSDNNKDCQLEQLTFCAQALETASKNNICENQCLSSCEITRYRLEKVKGLYLSKSLNISVKLSVEDFDYEIFQETYTSKIPTLQTLVAYLGGVLALWLGLDIFTILTLILAIFGALRTIYRCIFQEENKESVNGLNNAKKEEKDSRRPSVRVKFLPSETEFNSNQYLNTKQDTICPTPPCTNATKIDNTWPIAWKPKRKIAYMCGAVAIVVLALPTAFFTHQLVISFSSFSISSDVIIMTGSYQSIPLAITVCFPLSILETQEQTSEENEWKNMVDHFNTNITKTQFLNVNYAWPLALTYVVQSYLADLASYEMNDVAIKVVQNNGTSALFDFLQRILTQMDVTVDELRQKFGFEITQLNRIHFRTDNTVPRNSTNQQITCGYTTSQKTPDYSANQQMYGYTPAPAPNQQMMSCKTVTVSATNICYMLSINQYNYIYSETLASSSAIFIEEQGPRSMNTIPLPTTLSNEFSNKEDYITIDLLGRNYINTPALMNVDSNVYLGKQGQIHTVDIKLKAAYQMLPEVDGVVQCSNEQSITDCKAICQILEIIHKCGCMPNLINTFPHTTPTPCTLKSYGSGCTKLINSSTCKENCPDTCSKRTYDIKEKSSQQGGMNQDFTQQTTAIVLRFDNSFYLMYYEYFSSSFQDFTIKLGGTLALFLGINILGALRVALYAIIGLIAYLHRKCSGGTTSDRTQNHQQQGRIAKLLNFPVNTVDRVQWIMAKILKFTIGTVLLLFTLEISVSFIIAVPSFSNGSVIKSNITFNKSIALPKSELCIQLSLSETNGTRMSASDSKYMESMMGDIIGPMEKSLNSATMSDLCHIFHLYLAAIDYFETQNLQKDNNYYYNNYNNNNNYAMKALNFTPEFITKADKTILSALNTLDNVLETANITVDGLRQRFGLAFAEMFSLTAFQITTNYGSATQENIEIDRVVRVNQDEICYQFRLDLFPFVKNENKMIAITALPTDSSLTSEFNGTEKWLTFNFADGQMGKQNEFTITFDSAISKSYSIEAIHRQISVIDGITVACDQKTRQDCVEQCRFTFIRMLCGCSATSWPTMIRLGNNGCSLRTYLQCFQGVNGNFDGMCARSCLPSSQTIKYRSSEHMESSLSGARIQLQVSFFEYLSFEEIPNIYPFEIAAAVLGGFFSLFVGLSFWKILKFIASVFALFFDVVRCISEKH